MIHKNLQAMTIRQLGLKGNGIPAILHKETEGVYNPNTGMVEGGGLVDYAGSGIRVNYKSFDYRDLTIVHGDFRLYLSPQLQDGSPCPTPEIGDTVSFDDDLYKVVNFETWKAAHLECGWKIQVRKG